MKLTVEEQRVLLVRKFSEIAWECKDREHSHRTNDYYFGSKLGKIQAICDRIEEILNEEV